MPKIKNVFKWVNGVENEIYPGGGYTPTSDTLLYFPLTDDLLDHSGKSFSYSNTGNPTITTLNGVKCCQLNGSSTIDTNVNYFLNSTLMCWFNWSSGNSWFFGSQPCGIGQGIGMSITTASNCYVQLYGMNTGLNVSGSYQNQRHHYCFTNGKLYIDSVLKASYNSPSLSGTQPICIGGHNQNSNCTRQKVTGYIGGCIFENGEITSSRLEEYFNKTKKIYGL